MIVLQEKKNKNHQQWNVLQSTEAEQVVHLLLGWMEKKKKNPGLDFLICS